MERTNQNKMETSSMHKLIWKMGLPMIVSMILQSVYNIVDTAFVINMGEDGIAGNLALTYAFPIQLLIIAVGVGTGVGINALLSKQLGEKNGGRQRDLSRNMYLRRVFDLRSVRVRLVYLHAGGRKRASRRNGDKLLKNMLSVLFRLDRLYRLRTLFTGYGQNPFFHDLANFGRCDEYRARLCFYLPMQNGHRRRGVGDDHRTDRFADHRNAVSLSRQ